MNIYISGISGTGMGPLALIAKDAGMNVYGSDRQEGAITGELVEHGIGVRLGEQDGSFLESCHKSDKVDWFVYTSALPVDHPELVLAKKLGIKCSKRDELISYLIEELELKMVAVAGTHGKTTTTAMIVWACQKLGIPVSYLIGTTVPFAPSGHYEEGAKYFIYEADEYDRNFLHFRPWLAAITVVSYDHPDIYPTVEDYRQAFVDFEAQSEQVIYGNKIDADLTLAGEARRYDATLAMDAIQRMSPGTAAEIIIPIMNEFPGVGRRFEKLMPGVYTDYGHHPEEIKATVKIALEEAEQKGLKGVVAIYEPHQNTRQHSVRHEYGDVFEGVAKIWWLPTYLTREDPNLSILTPKDLIAGLHNKAVAEPAECNAELAEQLRQAHEDGYLILLMTAGPTDEWLRHWVESYSSATGSDSAGMPSDSSESGVSP